jgi:hypothetical protein
VQGILVTWLEILVEATIGSYSLKKEKLSPIAGEDALSEIHGHAEMRKARRGHHRLQQFIYICSNP